MTKSTLSLAVNRIIASGEEGGGGLKRGTNRYVTPREVKIRTLCLFFLSGSSVERGFAPVFDTDLYTEAIV